MDHLQLTAQRLDVKTTLSDRQIAILNGEMMQRRKSLGLAYLLWFFLGGLAIHRFYLDDKKNALVLMTLTIGGVLTSWIYIGFLPLLVAGVWLIVDAFLMPGMVQRANDRLEQTLVGVLTRQQG